MGFSTGWEKHRLLKIGVGAIVCEIITINETGLLGWLIHPDVSKWDTARESVGSNIWTDRPEFISMIVQYFNEIILNISFIHNFSA